MSACGEHEDSISIPRNESDRRRQYSGERINVPERKTLARRDGGGDECRQSKQENEADFQKAD